MVDTYTSKWLAFMCFRDGVPFNAQAVFTVEDAAAVTPEDIVRFFNMKAFKKEAPGPNDQPAHARASTLEFYKKAISSFMPRRIFVWDDIRREGNPTRSIQVNNLNKAVRKAGVRHQGRPTAARRPLELDEIIGMLSVMQREPHQLDKLRLAALLTTEWQLIGRLDDMLKLKYDNIKTNTENAFTLLVQLRWSKNITEEREAPHQLLVGSMDARLCVLFNLAIYIEMQHQFRPNAEASDFVFDPETCGRSTSENVRNSLAKAFVSTDSVSKGRGLLGSHSVRKGAATYGSRNGMSKDYIERRGRWRKNAGVVDRYIDPSLPYPDAVTASTLAGPSGPAKYERKPSHPYASDVFLVQSVAPGIAALLGRSTALVLTVPLPWAATTASTMMPAALKTKILAAVAQAGGAPDDVAVDRIPLHVTGEGGMVRFLELGSELTHAEKNGVEITEPSGGAVMRELVCMNAQVNNMKRRLEEINVSVTSEMVHLRSDVNHKLELMHNSLKRIAVRPAITARAHVAPTSTSSSYPAKLPKCPRDLYTLWQEYEFGRGGVKPAKQFTTRERGNDKTAYCRRKIFWDAVERMIRRGYTSDTAIDRIYGVYGHTTSVTRILEAMRVHRRDGGHPEIG